MGLGFSSSNLWSSLFTSILLPDWSVSSSLSEMYIPFYISGLFKYFSNTFLGIPNYICLRRSDQPVCVSSVVNIPDANTSLLTWTLFPKCSGSVNGRLSSVTDSSKCLWPKNIIILLVYLAQKFWPNLLYRETLVLEFFHHHRQRLRYMWNSLSILLSRPFYCGNILYRRWLYFLHSFYVMCQ